MAPVQLDLDTLAGGLRGDLLVPGDAHYDNARVLFNTAVDRHPAAIAQCRDAHDVALALAYAQGRDLDVSVRGGGHGVAGRALNDGGVVIDLRHLHQVMIDPATRSARVGGGATMRHLDAAAGAYGLATTGGRVSTTGVAGLTLGGGSGWLDRKFGLACDNLLAVELVTADGRVVRASESENPDLFWALHGGGGNFGVATAFTFRLHPLPAVTAAKLVWPADAGPEVVRAYRDFVEAAPDEVGGACLFLTAPPGMPPHLAGRLACAVVLLYAGTGSEACAALAPMLGLGHEAGFVTEVAYADFQCMNEDPPGFRNYWSADHLDEFGDEAVDRFCAHARSMPVPSPSASVVLHQGGALAREGADHPVPWRRAPWHVPRFAMWDDPADDERATAWARSLSVDLRPWASTEVYLNFIGDDRGDRLAAGWGQANLARLAAVKARYDPANIFRPHHNIRPA